MEMGRALLGLGRYDAAVQEGLKAIDSGYRTVYGLRCPCGVLRCGGQDAGGEGRDGGGDEIESQTLRGVVSCAHPAFIDSPPGFREALIKAGLPEE